MSRSLRENTLACALRHYKLSQLDRRAEPARPLLTLSLACSLTLAEHHILPSLNHILLGTMFSGRFV